MGYHFINIETGDHLYCEDNLWIEAFEAAKADGWKPDGTQYDMYYYSDEEHQFIDDDNHKLFTLIDAMKKTYTWEGSYTERENQIVTYEDAYYMAMSLKCAGVDEKLCEFVAKGSFRICSD